MSTQKDTAGEDLTKKSRIAEKQLFLQNPLNSAERAS
jgi:hypothetical protein